jgi:hypothetical protein
LHAVQVLALSAAFHERGQLSIGLRIVFHSLASATEATLLTASVLLPEWPISIGTIVVLRALFRTSIR